jgi:eukaryotic-like serine/threonine-protein kinase
VSVKVLDFGISKAPVGSGGITSTQAVMGSPHYMSPEQLVSAKHVDHRSDVWSLGIVLYETLAGSPPFTGDTMPEIVAKILQSPLPSLRAVRPDAPAEMEQVIARCTAKDPTARFRDVAELAHALVAFAPDAVRSADRATRILGRSVAPPSDKPATDAVAASLSPETSAQSEVRSQTAWGHTRAAGVPRRGVGPYAIAGVLGVAAIAAGFVVFGGHSPPTASMPVTAPSPRAEPLSPVMSIPAPVVLSPPPADSTAESPAPSVAPVAAKSAVVKLPRVLPKPASSTTVASAAPQPTAAPPPPPPADPLHMGIK